MTTPAPAKNRAKKDCFGCGWWKSLSNRAFKGVRIPRPNQSGWGSGKCIRPGGHCSPRYTR